MMRCAPGHAPRGAETEPVACGIIILLDGVKMHGVCARVELFRVILPRFDEPPTMHASARSLVQAQRKPPAPGGAVHVVCVE